eukprot:CAMPEP_0184211236 /NCGR_PEP_ID=MMETSP0976-20121227/13027_1 /TAXON_ID=483370 /ORGANISM="non described non described, Strain CCMP2097" /LENGTH=120 /DNA_ID=CAMNT_0026515937 /DNA_START=450 /DNA_END=808 /DNA_ORIENTATION=-
MAPHPQGPSRVARLRAHSAVRALVAHDLDADANGRNAAERRAARRGAHALDLRLERRAASKAAVEREVQLRPRRARHRGRQHERVDDGGDGRRRAVADVQRDACVPRDLRAERQRQREAR